MLTVLSPAKKLTKECTAIGSAHTKPVFLNQSKTLVNVLKSYDPPGLASLMGISEKLSELNWERYQSWTSNFSTDLSREAMYLFKGDTYEGLNAETLNESDISFAQDNIRILSGLYGVLRPLDLMLPYRLEMGTKLQNSAGKNLYEFWGDQLSNELVKELNNHKEKTIINCASNEYFKSIDNSGLNAEVVTPVFKEMKNGKSRIISFYAKKARGMMARFIVDNRIDKRDQILDFNLAGYKYDSASSEKNKPIFSRIQP
jgi:cytoplasmic iron level regulating protein YaaA (DUF328/UPF0246 family)